MALAVGNRIDDRHRLSDRCDRVFVNPSVEPTWHGRMAPEEPHVG